MTFDLRQLVLERAEAYAAQPDIATVIEAARRWFNLCDLLGLSDLQTPEQVIMLMVQGDLSAHKQDAALHPSLWG